MESKKRVSKLLKKHFKSIKFLFFFPDFLQLQGWGGWVRPNLENSRFFFSEPFPYCVDSSSTLCNEKVFQNLRWCNNKIILKTRWICFLHIRLLTTQVIHFLVVKLLAKSKLNSLPYNHTDHPPTTHP